MQRDKYKFIPSNEYRNILSNMPIPTVDVVLFDEDRKRTLLFLRKNPPVEGYYYSLGGRIWKNEPLEGAAKRKVYEEIGLEISEDKLIFGGVMDEFFNDSLFPSIDMHALNVYFGYVLSDKEVRLILLDEGQLSDKKWFFIVDEKICPYVKQKINILKENI